MDRLDWVEAVRLTAILTRSLRPLRRAQLDHFQEIKAREQERARQKEDKWAPRRWAIFFNVVVDGRTAREVAEYYGISEGRVRGIIGHMAYTHFLAKDAQGRDDWSSLKIQKLRQRFGSQAETERGSLRDPL
jgi:hypothetical protein